MTNEQKPVGQPGLTPSPAPQQQTQTPAPQKQQGDKPHEDKPAQQK